MPQLGEADRQAVVRMFAGASRPVEVRVVDPAAEASGQQGFVSLLREVSELAPMVRVRTGTPDELGVSVERTPALILFDAEGRDLGVRFSGFPNGYEFASLLAALTDAAAEGTSLAPATVSALEALAQDVAIKVFTTPT